MNNDEIRNRINDLYGALLIASLKLNQQQQPAIKLNGANKPRQRSVGTENEQGTAANSDR